MNLLRMKKMKTREERLAQMREYRMRTIEIRRAYDRTRYKEDKEKRNEYVKKWRANNPDKVKASIKNWVTNNKDKKYAIVRARHSRVKKARPNWLTSCQRKEILRMYENCPKDCHVDHIIPLKGKHVSGLHVPWNLQYLKIKCNLKKGNYYE